MSSDTPTNKDEPPGEPADELAGAPEAEGAPAPEAEAAPAPEAPVAAPEPPAPEPPAPELEPEPEPVAAAPEPPAPDSPASEAPPPVPEPAPVAEAQPAPAPEPPAEPSPPSSDATPAPEAPSDAPATDSLPPVAEAPPAEPPVAEQPAVEPPIAEPPVAEPPVVEPPVLAPAPSTTPPKPALKLGAIVSGSMGLGYADDTVTKQDYAAFLKRVEKATGAKISELKPAGIEKAPDTPLSVAELGGATVAQVQQALIALGMFPGGKVDGIYGYRTLSAVRLFQEFLRTQDGQAGGVPNGRCGANTVKHLQRWLESGKQPQWPKREGEYEAWLALLQSVKAKYLAAPNVATEAIEKFKGKSATRKVADWDVSPNAVHLIGVRRNEFLGQFDDIFVLLIKGMVFKFQGSTEAGSMSPDVKQPPFVLPGQHDYQYGWHKRSYLALWPRAPGALVARGRLAQPLTDDQIKKGVSANQTVQIHWGGLGIGRKVNTWSAGCQVINGQLYIDPSDTERLCPFAATFTSEPGKDAMKTRGAYSFLSDLVTALSGDLPDGDVIRYTLLMAEDLDLAPALKDNLASARARVLKRV